MDFREAWSITRQLPRMQRLHLTCSLALLVALGCGGGPAKISTRLHVGDEPRGGMPAIPVLIEAGNSFPMPVQAGAGGSNAPIAQPSLQVDVRDAAGAPLQNVTLPCSQACVEVMAVAHGGYPPYQFAWEDGTTNPERKICAGTVSPIRVRVTDSALDAGEFRHDAQQVMAELTVQPEKCPDVTKGAGAQASTCRQSMPPTCMLSGGIRLPEDVAVDVPGATQRYYAAGMMLPAGRYRVEYVTGCNTMGDPSLCGWTVHASTTMPGLANCFLVANDTTVIGVTPGTSGAFVDPDPMIGGAFATYEECVAANCTQPPFDFDFPGGKLGVQRDGGGALGAVDDLGGEAVGGASPTFRLSRLDPCL